MFALLVAVIAVATATGAKMVTFEMRQVSTEEGHASIEAFHLSPNSAPILVVLDRLTPEMVAVMELTDRSVLRASETGFRDVNSMVHYVIKAIKMVRARVRTIGQVSRNCVACIDNVLAEV